MQQKVYVTEENTATITCPQCDKSRTMDVELFLHVRRPMKVRCKCEHVFPIRLEGRKFYRKDADLPGTYAYVDRSQAGRIIVETLSFSGIGFRTLAPHAIAVDDVIQLSFALDNQHQSLLNKWIIIRWVAGQRIGSKFYEVQPYDKDIAMFLMPD